MTTETVTPMTEEAWSLANARYLASEMERLRLLVRRRVLWLRKYWQREAPQKNSGWAITDQETDLLLLGNDRDAELAFYREDPDAQQITHLLQDLSAQITAQRGDMQAEGRPAALDTLASNFGLAAFERDLMLLCLAPELDPAFERLYAYVQDNATRNYVTPHLAITLLANGEPQEAERTSFLSGSSLRRWRLLIAEPAEPGGNFSACRLRLDERMAAYLLGMNYLDPQCRSVLRAAHESCIFGCHSDVVAQLSEWLRNNHRPHPTINLIGSPDSGQVAIARALCAGLGLNLLLVDPQVLQAELDNNDLFSLLEREAVLMNLIFFLDADSLRPENLAGVMARLERFAAPLIIGSRNRVHWQRHSLAVSVARPGTKEQASLWREALNGYGQSFADDIETLVEQFDFGPQEITMAVEHARNQSRLRSPQLPSLSCDDLWQACRQQAAPQLEYLARKINPRYDWDDIVVPAEVQRQLREITAQVAQRHLVYQGWGFGQKLSRGRGISALFSGASGVGKTMAAEVMARCLNLDLYRIDLAGVVSKYIGETEKNLRCVFDAAERSGAILFFDEADALFGKRSEVKDSHDRYANIEINYLLQRMEDYRGLAILATNMKSALDTAFLRRLRFVVEFPFPDALHRREIWRRVFPAAAAVSGLDFNALARLEIAGGNIRNIAVNAAFLAADEQTAIGMEHVMRAARREYAKMERLVLDSEFGVYAGVSAS